MLMCCGESPQISGLATILIMQALLIHYHELALKGGNRGFFENVLLRELQAFLKTFPGVRIRKLPGRFLVDKTNNEEKTTDAEVAAWLEAVRRIPGIADFRPVTIHPAELAALTAAVPKEVTARSGTFAVRARRDRKDYPFTSTDLGREVGAAIAETTGMGVDLTHPDHEVHIEVAGNQAYVGADSAVRGYRGLPVGSAAKAVVMLSGGFDSPVAAHLMQCRGMEVHGIHFHSAPMVSRASLDKVRELSEILGRSQKRFRLILVPIVEFQKEVVAKCPESLRVLLYRRFMMRLACRLGHKGKAKALITGDALGQVASQTLENMTAVGEVATLPIIRPLVGLSKEWILEKSHEIGTHDVSVLPHEDCCGFLMPRKPATRATLERLEEAEEPLNFEELESRCLAIKETIVYDCGQPG